MPTPLIRAATALICLAAVTLAQGVQVYHFDGPRRASNIVLFGADTAAGVTVVHGQPDWKPEYEGMLSALKGKKLRLGKDLWTTFMTSAPVELGGVKVAPGCYCVGMQCDKDGRFSLALMDATATMKQGLMPFGPQTWKPGHLVPLTLTKDGLDDPASKMVIQLLADAEDKMRGTFAIHWGPHALTAPMKIHLARRK